MAANEQSKGFIGESQAMQDVRTAIEKVYKYQTVVLLLGETGTGKSFTARSIHNRRKELHDDSKSFEFVTINCSAVPESLIESALFGHEKGAFTGADKQKKGVFEQAGNGTVFLDEIGEIKPDIQIKLLNILNGEKYRRVGGKDEIEFKGYLVCATNKDLEKEVKEGRFREDLYYRINVYPITIPALRERKEDIPALLEYLSKKLIRDRGFSHDTEAIKIAIGNNSRKLQNLLYEWPGNIRELENFTEKALIESQYRKKMDEFYEGKVSDEPKETASVFLKEFYNVIEQAMAKTQPIFVYDLTAYMEKILTSILCKAPGHPKSLNDAMHDIMAEALDEAMYGIISSDVLTLPDNPTNWGKLLGHGGLSGGKSKDAGLGKQITYKYIREGLFRLYSRYDDMQENLKKTLGDGMYQIIEKEIKPSKIGKNSNRLSGDE